MPSLRRVFFSLLVAVLGAGFLRDQLERLPECVYAPSQEVRLLLQPPDTRVTMPIHTVRLRQIADTWHAPRDGGRRQHEGEDIFARKGTQVYSATSGVVIRAGNAGIGGNAVSVLGRGGRVYYYAHLSRFAAGLAIGETVNTETVLGYVGNTGNAIHTPSHLHFGVYGPEGAIDPLPLLTDYAEVRQNDAPQRDAKEATSGERKSNRLS